MPVVPGRFLFFSLLSRVRRFMPIRAAEPRCAFLERLYADEPLFSLAPKSVISSNSQARPSHALTRYISSRPFSSYRLVFDNKAPFKPRHKTKRRMRPNYSPSPPLPFALYIPRFVLSDKHQPTPSHYPRGTEQQQTIILLQRCLWSHLCKSCGVFPLRQFYEGLANTLSG